MGLLNPKYDKNGNEIHGPKKEIGSIAKFQWLFGVKYEKQIEFLDMVKNGLITIDQVKGRVTKFKVFSILTIILSFLIF
jgi:hypothetical protein